MAFQPLQMIDHMIEEGFIDLSIVHLHRYATLRIINRINIDFKLSIISCDYCSKVKNKQTP